MSKNTGKGSSRILNDSTNFSDLFNDPLLKEYENWSIEDLKNELEKLEKERDEKKLIFENSKKSHSLRDVIDKENVDDNITMNQSELQDHMIKEMLQDNKEREYEEILKAYRLTGKTIFPVKDDRIGLRFETFHGAKYHEPYYIILNQNQENEQLNVFRHTLPHFIPLDELEATYLNKDMHKFANEIGDYLQAFVTRREEFNTLIEEAGVSEAKSNNAFSDLEFMTTLDVDRR
ncbi:Cenp-O kinetochore centromere component-domain-containing protein [Glomus cerebriforme]|uniref:Cenp-O kinetochore centromere component-domain-containing protein n=1 Tax=Glomus cerebriforme TaxID=658196 RepID=A0A397TR93_9GLOM|nr:Cenp-O kinetochore centromere component-domain-containing protein [Glomus cerebriforme]